MSLYTSGISQKEMIFNATGSGVWDWFSKARLVTSPWPDIATSPSNYFSIKGGCWSEVSCRTFYINRRFSGCWGDDGWLVVSTQMTCHYEAYKTGILYSNKNTYAVWSRSGEFSAGNQSSFIFSQCASRWNSLNHLI